MEFRKWPSAEELDRFSKASKFLKLQAFAHSSHVQVPVLQLESSDRSIDSDTTHGSKDSDKLHVSTEADDRAGKATTAMPFSRPTLLTRHIQ